MKITKPSPVANTCPYCKCEFEYTKDDVNTYQITNWDLDFVFRTHYEKRLDCPNCFRVLVLQKY